MRIEKEARPQDYGARKLHETVKLSDPNLESIHKNLLSFIALYKGIEADGDLVFDYNQLLDNIVQIQHLKDETGASVESFLENFEQDLKKFKGKVTKKFISNKN